MIRAAIALLLLGLSACGTSDSYRASGMWQPTGANAGNLAAMAAQPSDLIVGRGNAPIDGRLSADAVDRLWQDRARALNTGAAAVATTSSK